MLRSRVQQLEAQIETGESEVEGLMAEMDTVKARLDLEREAKEEGAAKIQELEGEALRHRLLIEESQRVNEKLEEELNRRQVDMALKSAELRETKRRVEHLMESVATLERRLREAERKVREGGLLGVDLGYWVTGCRSGLLGMSMGGEGFRVQGSGFRVGG